MTVEQHRAREACGVEKPRYQPKKKPKTYEIRSGVCPVCGAMNPHIGLKDAPENCDICGSVIKLDLSRETKVFRWYDP